MLLVLLLIAVTPALWFISASLFVLSSQFTKHQQILNLVGGLLLGFSIGIWTLFGVVYLVLKIINTIF